MSDGIRSISGYTPRERGPVERVVSYKKEIERLESLLEMTKRNLASAEKALRRKCDEQYGNPAT